MRLSLLPFQWIKNVFKAPVFQEEQQTHYARLLTILLWAFLAAELSGALVTIAIGLWSQALALFLAALATFGLVRMSRFGSLELVSILHLGISLLLLTYLVYLGNGIHDIALLAYPALILLASLLLNRKRFILLVGLCLLSIGFVGMLEIWGGMSTEYGSLTSYSDLFVIWIILILTAIAARVLADDLNHNLDRARHNEQRLAEVNRDLEERAEALKLSEERWRSLVENAPDLILNITGDGTILFTNGQLEGSGISMVGQSIYEFVPPQQRAQARALVAQVVETGEPASSEIASYRKKDETGWYSARISPIFDKDRVASLTVIATDITERRRAEIDVQRMNATLEERVSLRTAELEAKNRELETFTYSVSHDLKAPLRGIDGYAHLLIDKYSPQMDEEGRSFLHTIRQATQQMNQLINDLLTYSHLEQRAIQTDRVNLPELVKMIVKERWEEIERRQIDFSMDVACQTVTAEVEGLAQALRNLLDNALKFTTQTGGARIEVGCRESEQVCLLWIKDNGIGFDMQYHDRIFEIFQRLNRAEQFPGTGVGLALVSKVMQRMGGRVWATSYPGAGATFYLEIPK